MSKISLKRFNSLLLAGILVCIVLFYARQLLIPVTFSIFFAMLMTPVSNKLEHWGCSRLASTFISLLILIISFSAIIMVITMQAKNMAQDFPKMQKKATELVDVMTGKVEEKFNIPKEKQKQYLSKQAKTFMSSSGSFVRSFLTSATGILTAFFLVLFSMFLLLYEREKYETFFLKISGSGPMNPPDKTLNQISKVAQHYLAGRMLSVLIFTVLFTIGMMIVGLKNAFLISLIAALMTIVPYVGSILGGAFPFLFALVSSDSTNVAFGALAVVVIVQMFDNYFIEPYIIGGEVNISPLATILVLFIGGLIWGAAGMILFIPVLGVAKIIFDNTPGLEPYGFLIGTQSPSRQSTKLINFFKNLTGKKYTPLKTDPEH
jgi:predicted PurR-regulated permease PerM